MHECLNRQYVTLTLREGEGSASGALWDLSNVVGARRQLYCVLDKYCQRQPESSPRGDGARLKGRQMLWMANNEAVAVPQRRFGRGR